MEMSGEHHAPTALPPKKELSVPFGWETSRAPESIWTLWRREKSCIAGNRTQHVAVPIPDNYTKLLQIELPACLEDISL
jgi:hypothetical protein